MAVVLITGCSSGFGKLTAEEFARRGDKVYATMRTPAKAGALTSAVEAAGRSVDVLPLDVNDDASVRTAITTIMDADGRIDVLVNNAGVGIHGSIEDTADDEVRSVFETNVFGLLRMTRAVTPLMRAQGSGTIVNVGSLTGKLASPFGGIYAASKHAVEAISDALHFELHPFGIRVVLIEPGRFETGFGANRMLVRGFNEGSAYAGLEQRFEAALANLNLGQAEGAQAADPRDVAVTIADAAHAESPQRRYPVGADAKLLSGLHKQLSDDDFERTIRTTLNFWE